MLRSAQEMGLRMALGATPGEIHRLSPFEGMKITLAGVLIAIAVSAGLAPFSGLSPVDPLTFAVSAGCGLDRVVDCAADFLDCFCIWHLLDSSQLARSVPGKRHNRRSPIKGNVKSTGPPPLRWLYEP